MAYRDTYIARLKMLIGNPREQSKKVWPFLKSRMFPYQRRILELFGIYNHSKPFSGHEAFLPYVDFKNGFFVQYGGMDGYGNDPTYYLEKALGWSGIIVEPMPVYKTCQKNRSRSKVYNFAVGSFEDSGKIVPFVDCFGMSFVKGSIDNEDEWVDIGEKTQGIKAVSVDVTLKPIQEIIDDYFAVHPKKNIDLLVADVEGYELKTLQGLDFQKNSPSQILLESTEKNFPPLKDFLESRNYVMVTRINNDYLFKLSHS